MSIIPLTEAKSRLSEIADEIHRTHERVSVTRNGREYVVIMSAEDLDSLEATIELHTDPAAQARIAQAVADIDRGDVRTLFELNRIMLVGRPGGALRLVRDLSCAGCEASARRNSPRIRGLRRLRVHPWTSRRESTASRSPSARTFRGLPSRQTR
jgi:prevent-host-death family protein